MMENQLATVKFLTKGVSTVISVLTLPPRTHLVPTAVRLALEGPGHLGLQGFGDALQEGAAALHPIQLLLSDSVLVVVWKECVISP